MTRLPRPRREIAGQDLLFDDALTDRVLRDAADPGFVLVGVTETVHTRTIGTRAAEHAIPVRPDIAATVHHLLTAGRLTHGPRISVTVDGRPEPESATTVEVASTATGRPALGDRVPVQVDVIRAGFALVTCPTADFSGSMIRDDGTYRVETGHGDTIARARSYRAGAERLARHHGYRADPIEVAHDKETADR